LYLLPHLRLLGPHDCPDAHNFGQWFDSFDGFNHCSLHSECVRHSLLIWDAGFDSNSVLTYSTLQTMGLGAGSSNAPLQGSAAGTTSPFNAIPYGGGHIPPSSPSLGGAFQQPIRPNANYSLFSGGIQGPSSYTTLVGSMSFSLFGAFGNNSFTFYSFSTGGNPVFSQQNHVQGFIPS
jgi:hypothetical protein